MLINLVGFFFLAANLVGSLNEVYCIIYYRYFHWREELESFNHSSFDTINFVFLLTYLKSPIAYLCYFCTLTLIIINQFKACYLQLHFFFFFWEKAKSNFFSCQDFWYASLKIRVLVNLPKNMRLTSWL